MAKLFSKSEKNRDRDVNENTGRARRKRMNRDIFVVTIIFVCLFLGIAAYYIAYVNVWSQDYITSSYNNRQDLMSEYVLRGDIIARDGTVLATTILDGENQKRVYNYGGMYAQVLGYASHGKAGIERYYNNYLLSSHIGIAEQIINTFKNDLNAGDTVVTTLDPTLQEIAYTALKQYEAGAVVALDPNTGEILCMVSWPSYDPNTIDDIWEEINSDSESSVLVNRATSGYYMPGSTFKICTALAAYRQLGTAFLDNYYYDCEGAIQIDDYVVSCDSGAAHGTVGLRGAFAQSCNGYFISLGVKIDPDSWTETAEDLLFNTTIDFDLSDASGSFSLDSDSTTWEAMLTSIGHGETLVTPLQNALIAAAVANDGVIMRPYIVSKITNAYGNKVKSFENEVMSDAMTQEEADMLTELMIAVVNEGTATNLQSLSYQVAGKTGTAQRSSEEGDSNKLFTGFAPADNPQIVVSVVVEGGGNISSSATGIAKQIFEAYLG